MALNKVCYLLLLLGLLAFLTSGCSTARKTLGLVNNIDITIKAEKDVNPDANGNPTPVLVKFYELSDIEAFRNADFTALMNNEQAAIGKTIVRREEFELKPEEHRSIVRRAKKGVRYIGILAAYQNVTNIKWRTIVSLNPDGTTEFVLHLEKTGMTVSKE
ncbi:type VI secretion system lipoprotein TssJ [Kaarinaea lacus]